MGNSIALLVVHAVLLHFLWFILYCYSFAGSYCGITSELFAPNEATCMCNRFLVKALVEVK